LSGLEAQHLISNPSFEERTSCPYNHTTPQEPIKTRYWFAPGTVTPDLFSNCLGGGKMATPRNFMDYAQPVSGCSHVGLYMGRPDGQYREYLSCALMKPLVAEKSYRLIGYMRPVHTCRYAPSLLSFALTAEAPGSDDDALLALDEVVIYRADALLLHNGWLQLDYVFMAHGDEAYLTIGDLIPSAQNTFTTIAGYQANSAVGGSSDYYFDQFSLVP